MGNPAADGPRIGGEEGRRSYLHRDFVRKNRIATEESGHSDDWPGFLYTNKIKIG